MKTKWLVLLAWLPLTMQAQTLDTSTVHRVQLKDGTPVTLFAGFAEESQLLYYYLPTNFRLSVRADGTPEFSFLTYAAEEGQEASGAILHLLLVWGLSQEQEQEASAWLQKNVDSLAVLAGVVSLEVPSNVPSFNILGKSKLAEVLRTRMNQQPIVPVIPGTKLALSYRLNSEETKLFQEAMSKPDKFKDIVFELVFTYRGGNPRAWYNLIKGEHYQLSADLRTLLNPVLNPKKQKDGK